MKFRIASIALFLAVLGIGVSWLTFQPVLTSWIDLARRFGEHSAAIQTQVARMRTALPLFLFLGVGLVALTAYGVLHLTVVQPLLRAESAVEQMSKLDLNVALGPGGPLLDSLQGALRRMADALGEERRVTQRQMDALRVANEKLSLAHTELMAADRLASVGKLAAGVAHEVGNPLSGILGYLSILRSRVSSPETVEWVSRIEQEVQRIDGIVRSLLQLGRPVQSKSTPMELKPVLESCIRLLGAGADFRDCEVVLEGNPDCVVLGQPGPLSQIVVNLLINAAQAMEGRGKIVVQVGLEAKSVLLSVRDSGPGLSAEALAHLFEPFFSTKAAGRGTGLGLAVSKHLAGQLGGELTAGNQVGGGACFVLRLPAE